MFTTGAMLGTDPSSFGADAGFGQAAEGFWLRT